MSTAARASGHRSREALATIGLFLMPLLFGAPSLAQSPSPAIRQIPVASNGFHARMSPDGSRLAVFDDAALVEYEPDPALLPIRLIDLVSGEQTTALEGFTDYAADVAFSPDGTRLASWHWNGVLIVWDVSGSEPRTIARFPTGTVGNGRIAFLPDGRTLMAETPGSPTWFHLTDTSSGAVTNIMGPAITSYAGLRDAARPGPSYDFQYSAMTVSPDGTTLATASYNGEVAVWRIPDGQPRTIRPADPSRMGRADIRQLAFVGGPDALWWYDRSDERTHVWDVATGTESGSLGVGGDPFAVSSESAQLAWVERTEDDRASVGLVDLYGSVAPFSLGVLDGRPASGITTIAYTPDRSTIVVGGLFVPDGANALYLIPSPW